MGLFSNKYYFVSAKNIQKAILVKNNNGVDYDNKGRLSVDGLFLMNGIDNPDYQKLVLGSSVRKLILSRLFSAALSRQNYYYVQELISGCQFCKVLQSKSGDKNERLINVPFSKELFDVISVDFINTCVSKQEVIDFLFELRKKHLMNSYLDTLRQIFELSTVAMKNIESKCVDCCVGEPKKVLKL